MASLPLPLKAPKAQICCCWMQASLRTSLLLLLAGTSLALQCPPRCDCPPASGGSVLCARRRLLAVPGSAPGSARSLDLSRNHVARLGAGDLAAWAALEELDLSENALGALEPGSFAGLGALRSLSLRCNRIAVLPIGAFAALGALRRLDLSGNRMRAVPRGAFSGLGALGSLDLSENSLLWVAQGAFEGLGALRSLSLRRAGLRALPSGALARLPALSELDASGNSLRALGPRCLRGVPRLRVLRLSGAGLRRVEPGALRGLPALRDLDLSENALDSLPERAGAPLALRALRLDGNPIACDCRLLWLRTRPSPEALLGGGEGPPCAAPPEARGARLLSAPLRCRAPRVRLRAGPVAVRAGGAVRIPCSARGDPPPSLAWRDPRGRWYEHEGDEDDEGGERQGEQGEQGEAGEQGENGGEEEDKEEEEEKKQGDGKGGDDDDDDDDDRERGPRLRVLRDGSLLLVSARVRDRGSYTCVASSAAGRHLRAVPLVVSGPGGVPPPSLSDPSDSSDPWDPADPWDAVDPADSESFNATGTRGETREPAGTPLTPLTPLLLVSAGLGGLTFLGVVILCLLVLAAGTRSWGHKRRRRTRQRTELEYGGTRRSRGGPRSPSRAPPRHFVMRMM
ncbi:uncharacterized protein LOC144949199 [Lampetra fluviatilis]